MATANINYSDDKDLLVKFLQNYEEDYGGDGDSHKYIAELQAISNRTKRVLEIELDDVDQYLGEEMVDKIQSNTRRYAKLFSDAIDEAMPEPTEFPSEPDVFDGIMDNRRRQQEADGSEGQGQLPPDLTRRYEIRFLPAAKSKALPLRQLKADSIGQLISVKGIVTRVTEVKPQISVATYACEQCGFEIYQQVTSQSFMPIFACPSPQCQASHSNGKVHLQTRGSKFSKYQEVKIQELAEQVPMGSVPRTITVHLYGELTRACLAGDIITVSGVFLPIPYTGFKAIRAGLIADTYLEAMGVSQHKKSYTDFTPSADMLERIQEAHESGEDIYTQLAQSVAPEIYGHEDVKKALLLLLVGGVTKKQKDGMKIRGDINICLMGDPGVAKSQLLKHITTIAPRAIYTSGKGSSGVGLTAAVIKDPSTNEYVLEGGALVLADMGICCIDEFDKMEESDRTAIHEVMEQQTVSIAKAGITTTLNARTAILAAANPVFSRYNTNRTASENINLPPALLSRFDLMFLILDVPKRDHDKKLAEHVCYVHMNSIHPPTEHEALEPAFMRAFISQARKYEPYIPEDLSEYIVNEYVDLRQEDHESADPMSFTSARTLLAILRLSQALARLRFQDKVSRQDVDEARRLMQMCKSSLVETKKDKKGQNTDPVSAIYNLIKKAAGEKAEVAVRMADIDRKALQAGYTQDQVQQCLAEYEQLNVWSLNQTRTILRFAVTSA